MEKAPECYGIIPARYASHRFPGKPLVEISGEPMFSHVARRSARCPLLSSVTLATDDLRIFDAAQKWGVPVVMTREDHVSGTDRVLEAARIIGVPNDAVVVNIQGDEPLLEPDMLTELLAPFSRPEVLVTTLAGRISPEEARNPDRVKVVFSENGRALYFSRSPIPFPRGKNPKPLYVHVGIYAFRMHILKKFVSLGSSRLETTEKLEQLRLLENDIPIQIVETAYKSIGVDRPEDIGLVEEILKKGDPLNEVRG